MLACSRGHFETFKMLYELSKPLSDDASVVDVTTTNDSKTSLVIAGTTTTTMLILILILIQIQIQIPILTLILILTSCQGGFGGYP